MKCFQTSETFNAVDPRAEEEGISIGESHVIYVRENKQAEETKDELGLKYRFDDEPLLTGANVFPLFQGVCARTPVSDSLEKTLGRAL